jgi:H+/Cl- antiporter ClcA
MTAANCTSCAEKSALEEHWEGYELAAGVAAGFNAPISGVFFAVEAVLQKPCALDEYGDVMDSSVAANSSGLTIAMVLLASVVAAVVSQVPTPLRPSSANLLLRTCNVIFL